MRWLVPALFPAFLLLGLTGRWLAPADPSDVDLALRYLPPFHRLGHLLGTDQLGRDVLSRMLAGATLSLSLTFVVIASAALLGGMLGMAAGFARGWLDATLMRFADAALSLPAIMLALVLVAVIGPGFASVAIALLLVTWARYARFVRGEVLSLAGMEFIDAAIVCGTPFRKILLRHLLPNLLGSVIAILTLDIGRVVLLESSLAFLGLGVPPDQGSWGATIAEGKAYLQLAPWIALVPAVAMMVTILMANSFGTWLSARLDPRLAMLAS